MIIWAYVYSDWKSTSVDHLADEISPYFPSEHRYEIWTTLSQYSIDLDTAKLLMIKNNNSVHERWI